MALLLLWDDDGDEFSETVGLVASSQSAAQNVLSLQQILAVVTSSQSSPQTVLSLQQILAVISASNMTYQSIVSLAASLIPLARSQMNNANVVNMSAAAQLISQCQEAASGTLLMNSAVLLQETAQAAMTAGNNIPSTLLVGSSDQMLSAAGLRFEPALSLAQAAQEAMVAGNTMPSALLVGSNGQLLTTAGFSIETSLSFAQITNLTNLVSLSGAASVIFTSLNNPNYLTRIDMQGLMGLLSGKNLSVLGSLNMQTATTVKGDAVLNLSPNLVIPVQVLAQHGAQHADSPQLAFNPSTALQGGASALVSATSLLVAQVDLSQRGQHVAQAQLVMPVTVNAVAVAQLLAESVITSDLDVSVSISSDAGLLVSAQLVSQATSVILARSTLPLTAGLVIPQSMSLAEGAQFVGHGSLVITADMDLVSSAAVSEASTAIMQAVAQVVSAFGLDLKSTLQMNEALAVKSSANLAAEGVIEGGVSTFDETITLRTHSGFLVMPGMVVPANFSAVAGANLTVAPVLQVNGQMSLAMISHEHTQASSIVDLTMTLTESGRLSVLVSLGISQTLGARSSAGASVSPHLEAAASLVLTEKSGIELLTRIIANATMTVTSVARLVAEAPIEILLGFLEFKQAELAAAGFTEQSLRVANFRQALLDSPEFKKSGFRKP